MRIHGIRQLMKRSLTATGSECGVAGAGWLFPNRLQPNQAQRSRPAGSTAAGSAGGGTAVSGHRGAEVGEHAATNVGISRDHDARDLGEVLMVASGVVTQPGERGGHAQSMDLGEHPLAMSSTPRLFTAACSRGVTALLTVVSCRRIAMVATWASACARFRSSGFSAPGRRRTTPTCPTPRRAAAGGWRAPRRSPIRWPRPRTAATSPTRPRGRRH